MKIPRSWYPGRFLLIVLGGVAVGYVTAAVSWRWRPAVYRSSALVAGNRHDERVVPLAPVHAALIRRDDEDDGRPPAKVPGGDLSKAVSFRAFRYGVEVRVLSHDPKDGIHLAERAAMLFRGMDEELAVAAVNPAVVPRAGELLHRERVDAKKLRGLLADDAKAAGFRDAFEVRDRAANGNATARKLWKSESFQARWTMFEELATRIGIDSVPGDPLTAPPVVVASCRDDQSYTSAKVARWLDGGMGIGAVLGLAAAFFLARRIPPLQVEDPGSLPDAAVEW